MKYIMEENKQEVKYSSYTESQKRATKKYRENNKDKVNEQRKKYYINRKEKDPNFLSYKRQKAKEYYAKKKELRNNKIEELEKKVEEVIKEIDIPKVEDVKVEEIKVEEIPVIDETNIEKKKRRYTRKNKTA